LVDFYYFFFSGVGGSFQFFQSLLEFCSLTKEGFTNKFKYCSSQRPLCPARGGGGQGEVGTPRPSAPHSPALLVGGNPQGGCCTQFSGLWDSTVPSNSQLTLPDPAKASGVSQGLLCPTPVQFRKPVPAWRCWFSPSAASPDSRWEDWGAPHCPVAWGWTGCWGGAGFTPHPPRVSVGAGCVVGAVAGGQPLYGPVRPSSALYSPVWCSADLHGHVQPSTTLYSPVWCTAVLYSPVQPSVAQYRPVQTCVASHGAVQSYRAKHSPVQPTTSQSSPPNPSTAHHVTVEPSISQHSPVQPSTDHHVPVKPSISQYSLVHPSSARYKLAQYSPVQPTMSQSSPPHSSTA